MKVLVVIPTRNSSTTLEACLRSIKAQTRNCELVVVDNVSLDRTRTIARQYTHRVIQAGPERSAQRNVGARETEADIVGFIDSDMVLSPDVVREVVERIAKGAGGVIVPEITVGEGYWARVRAFERAFYLGSDSIEAARFFRRDLFELVGGFDEDLTGAEDWDVSEKVRKLARIDRIEAHITHLEGRVTFLGACRKKAYYAEGVRLYVKKNGMSALTQGIARPWLRHPIRLLTNPLGIGLIVLKTGEAAAMWLAIVRSRIKARVRFR